MVMKLWRGRRIRRFRMERECLTERDVMEAFRGGRSSGLWKGIKDLLVALEDGELAVGGEYTASAQLKAEGMVRVDELRQVRAQIEERMDEAERYFKER